MTGGRGGVVGTVIGALMMTVISNAIVTMRISTYWEQVVIGAVVIIAVFIDAMRTRKARQGIKG
jgi:ribose transport system permease protein